MRNAGGLLGFLTVCAAALLMAQAKAPATPAVPGVTLTGSSTVAGTLTINGGSVGAPLTVNGGSSGAYAANVASTNIAQVLLQLNSPISASANMISGVQGGVGTVFTVGPSGAITLSATSGDLLTIAAGGYLRYAKTFVGAPTAADCDAAGELGRMAYDTSGDLLYFCTGAGGWKKTAFTP